MSRNDGTVTRKEPGAAGSSSVLMRVGAVLAGMAVLAGALGTHELHKHLTPSAMEIFRTAVFYQLLHGVAVVAIAGGMSHFDKRRLAIACWIMVLGTALFSGSLFVLALAGSAVVGFVTPVGGVLLVVSWALVVGGSRKLPRRDVAL